MLKKFIIAYLRLFKYFLFPFTLGCIACHIGPSHSWEIKMALGELVGFAIQHRFMMKEIRNFAKVFREFFDR